MTKDEQLRALQAKNRLLINQNASLGVALNRLACKCVLQARNLELYTKDVGYASELRAAGERGLQDAILLTKPF